MASKTFSTPLAGRRLSPLLSFVCHPPNSFRLSVTKVGGAYYYRRNAREYVSGCSACEHVITLGNAQAPRPLHYYDTLHHGGPRIEQ